MRTRQPVCQPGGQPGVALPHRLHEGREVLIRSALDAPPVGQVTARQAGAAGPGTAGGIVLAQLSADGVGRVLGQLAEGGDLAAPDRQQRRQATIGHAADTGQNALTDSTISDAFTALAKAVL